MFAVLFQVDRLCVQETDLRGQLTACQAEIDDLKSAVADKKKQQNQTQRQLEELNKKSRHLEGENVEGN